MAVLTHPDTAVCQAGEGTMGLRTGQKLDSQERAGDALDEPGDQQLFSQDSGLHRSSNIYE